MLTIEIDDKGFQKSMNGLLNKLGTLEKAAEKKMAETLLALSRLEVPHDTGQLEASGHVGEIDGATYVGYNKEYAAYMHEGIRKDGSHKVTMYQKGRKKKYLEDPLKLNLSKWLEIARNELAGMLS